MPTSLEAQILLDGDPDLVFGKALIEYWAGRELSGEDYRLARKRFYSAANAGQTPVAKYPGIGWVGRRSAIEQHRRELIERADQQARERVGMAPRAA
jgi:hypothetical protein